MAHGNRLVSVLLSVWRTSGHSSVFYGLRQSATTCRVFYCKKKEQRAQPGFWIYQYGKLAWFASFIGCTGEKTHLILATTFRAVALITLHHPPRPCPCRPDKKCQHIFGRPGPPGCGDFGFPSPTSTGLIANITFSDLFVSCSINSHTLCNSPCIHQNKQHTLTHTSQTPPKKPDRSQDGLGNVQFVDSSNVVQGAML